MTQENQNTPVAAGTLFVARQPIFNTDKTIHGYEILFRSGYKNCYDPSVDQDYASGRALSDTYMTFGIDELTGGRRAFINFTQKHLEEEVPGIFPKDHMVVEILENVEPTEKLVNAIKHLKSAGYTIALDDFVNDPKFLPLIELADIIKVDFLISPPAERAELVKRYGPRGIRFLAEKVETNEEFVEAQKMGYTLFQGYFFAKPQILLGTDIPGFKLNYIQIVREVNAEEMDFDKIEAIVRRDLSLSYKFLRFMNSPHFGFSSEITSIRQALRILGMRGIRTWLSLVALTALGEDKPRELVITGLLRALFLEKLATETGHRSHAPDLFLIGLFSVIDAILDRPMDVILNDLPLGSDVKDALTGGDNLLRDFYEVMISYEHADWDTFSNYCKKLGIDEQPVPVIYRKVVTEATEIEKNIAG